MFGRQKFAMVVAEFLGTYVLATAMLSMLVRTNFAFFSAVAAGLVYALMLVIFGGISGSHLNPAVTIGLWTLRKIKTLDAVVYIIAQALGGFVAFRVGEYLLKQTLSPLATGGVDTRAMVAEGIGALIFGFGIAAAVVNKNIDTGKQVLIVGFALVIGIMVASVGSNALLNPAVALGVKSWSWAYTVGPIVGAVVGMNLYTMLFTGSVSKAKSK
ncbi:MAG TPA: aquaporin [Candidatus Saccharimonadales bacterium]|nr:aquaporin [Candidatus Saccharimonadales bacterium]